MFEDLEWTAVLADDLLFEKVMTLSTQQKITAKISEMFCKEPVKETLSSTTKKSN